MSYITIPINLNDLNDKDPTIDMSDLRFPPSLSNKKRSSFIFLRNSGIKATLDFTKCSYEDKEEFLLLYFLEEIEINAEILSSTWMEILLSKYNGEINLPSILSKDEILRFTESNKEFILDIYQFINSLPLYTISIIQTDTGSFDMSEFQHTDYNKLKLCNFYTLAKYNQFSLLLDPTTNQQPVFYDKMFKGTNRFLWEMMNSLPYINIINGLLAPPDLQLNIISDISAMFNPVNEQEECNV